VSKPFKLPTKEGNLIVYQASDRSLPPPSNKPPKSRVAFAAAHVVSAPLIDSDPLTASSLDWDKTLAYRRYLWSLGLSVAEVMDTAQRGMGLNWKTTQELIRLSLAEAKIQSGSIACGAGTDHMELNSQTKLGDIIRAYLEQCDFIEKNGGQIILMASQALAAVAKTPEDYAFVYKSVLSQISQPVILHWLGNMFDPKLKGYWGSHDLKKAMTLCLNVIEENKEKIDGIKISLLDADLEITMRSRLPEGIKMYTGDDFNYPDLILGDQQKYSHALLGIFDAIAPLASAALKYLDEGDIQHYKETLSPTVPLSQHIFTAPTRFYKTGIVFLAYLNGHQDHFKMVGGLESMRSIVHLSELFILADQAGLLRDPELAISRMKKILDLAGGI
jgi:hypothetical protein